MVGLALQPENRVIGVLLNRVLYYDGVWTYIRSWDESMNFVPGTEVLEHE